jgi:hypothetical protein
VGRRIARTLRLQRTFNEAHALLDEIEAKLADVANEPERLARLVALESVTTP